MIGEKKEFWNPPAFLPRPLLRAGNQPRQGESFPPDKLFRPAESALVVLIIWILLEIVSNFVQYTPPSVRSSRPSADTVRQNGCEGDLCKNLLRPADPKNEIPILHSFKMEK